MLLSYTVTLQDERDPKKVTCSPAHPSHIGQRQEAPGNPGRERRIQAKGEQDLAFGLSWHFLTF